MSAAPLKKYEVKIFYSEPLFCKTIGKDPNTLFETTFVIQAENEEQAIEEGKKEFIITAHQSWVHWERILQKWTVRELSSTTNP